LVLAECLKELVGCYGTAVYPVNENIERVNFDISDWDNAVVGFFESAGKCAAKVAGVVLEEFGM